MSPYERTKTFTLVHNLVPFSSLNILNNSTLLSELRERNGPVLPRRDTGSNFFVHKLIRLSELRERNGPVLPRRDSGGISSGGNFAD